MKILYEKSLKLQPHITKYEYNNFVLFLLYLNDLTFMFYSSLPIIL